MGVEAVARLALPEQASESRFHPLNPKEDAMAKKAKKKTAKKAKKSKAKKKK
jgi:hypothetical protein